MKDHKEALNNIMENVKNEMLWRLENEYQRGYDDGLARGTENGYKRGYESGKKVHEEIREKDMDMGYQQGYIDGVNQMVKELKAEQHTGEWIDVGLTKEMYVRKCRCTNCGEWNIGLPLELPAYCGICGAKMTSDKYMLYGDEPFKVESE